MAIQHLPEQILNFITPIPRDVFQTRAGQNAAS